MNEGRTDGLKQPKYIWDFEEMRFSFSFLFFWLVEKYIIVSQIT